MEQRGPGESPGPFGFKRKSVVLAATSMKIWSRLHPRRFTERVRVAERSGWIVSAPPHKYNSP
jgi:hypothetical protein